MAEKVLKEGKPVDCPTCGAEGVPSHKMRGLSLPGDKVIWDCVTCRNTRNNSMEGEPVTEGEGDKVLWGCAWCNEEKMVSPGDDAQEFCSEGCEEGYREATKSRTQKAVNAVQVIP